MALDHVYQYYNEKGKLHDRIELGDKEWPMDPFNEKPLRYKKTGKKSFIIFSVGPDEKDDKGDNLLGGRAIYEEKSVDVGYHILLQ